MRAYLNLNKFDFRREFRPWLLSIVRNLAIDLLRKRQRTRTSDVPASSCPQETGGCAQREKQCLTKRSRYFFPAILMANSPNRTDRESVCIWSGMNVIGRSWRNWSERRLKRSACIMRSPVQEIGRRWRRVWYRTSVEVWAVAVTSYGLWELATAPDDPLTGKLLVFGFFLAVALLFCSVLTQRMRESRTDKYRGVYK